MKQIVQVPRQLLGQIREKTLPVRLIGVETPADGRHHHDQAVRVRESLDA
jgi:hypothetical protein